MIEPIGYVGTNQRIDQVMIRKADLPEAREGLECTLGMAMGPKPVRFVRLSMVEECESLWLTFIDDVAE